MSDLLLLYSFFKFFHIKNESFFQGFKKCLNLIFMMIRLCLIQCLSFSLLMFLTSYLVLFHIFSNHCLVFSAQLISCHFISHFSTYVPFSVLTFRYFIISTLPFSLPPSLSPFLSKLFHFLFHNCVADSYMYFLY